MKSKELVNQLRANYKDEIKAYEKYVLNEVNKNLFLTGDKVLDKTIAMVTSYACS